MAVFIRIHPTPSFQPRGAIASIFPDGWRGGQYDYRFAQPYPVAAQPFPSSFQPQGFIRSTFPDGWRGAQWDVKFTAPFAASQQQFPSSLQPQGLIPSPPAPKGWQAQFDIKISAPINAALHEFFAPLPQGPPLPTNGSGSFDAIIISSRIVGDQSWYPLAPTTQAPNTTTKGWAGYQLDCKFAVPFPAAQQQWAAFQAQGAITSVGNSGQAGAIFFSAAGGLKIRLLSTNPTLPLAPPAQNQTVYPDGWRGYQYDLAFAKPYPIGDQPFTASPAPQVPKPPGNGWWGFQWEVRYAAPLAAAQQQYAAFQPRGAIVSATPQGWNGWQFDYKFAKANSPSLPQEWFPPLALQITPNTTAWRQQSLNPERFKAPFSVTLQQFDALGMVPEAQIQPPVLPQGGGGAHRKKPVQPIWDRQRELDRARAASAGTEDGRPLSRREKRVARAAEQARAAGQTPNLSGLADLLLPTVGGQAITRPSTAVPVVTLPAVRATATITETGLDVARGLVSTTDIIRADALITEAPDQLHASASVNDDGQALKMLEAAHKADRKAAADALRDMLASEDDPEAIEEYRAVLAALEGKE